MRPGGPAGVGEAAGAAVLDQGGQGPQPGAVEIGPRQRRAGALADQAGPLLLLVERAGPSAPVRQARADGSERQRRRRAGARRRGRRAGFPQHGRRSGLRLFPSRLHRLRVGFRRGQDDARRRPARQHRLDVGRAQELDVAAMEDDHRVLRLQRAVGLAGEDLQQAHRHVGRGEAAPVEAPDDGEMEIGVPAQRAGVGDQAAHRGRGGQRPSSGNPHLAFEADAADLDVAARPDDQDVAVAGAQRAQRAVLLHPFAPVVVHRDAGEAVAARPDRAAGVVQDAAQQRRPAGGELVDRRALDVAGERDGRADRRHDDAVAFAQGDVAAEAAAHEQLVEVDAAHLLAAVEVDAAQAALPVRPAGVDQRVHQRRQPGQVVDARELDLAGDGHVDRAQPAHGDEHFGAEHRPLDAGAQRRPDFAQRPAGGGDGRQLGDDDPPAPVHRHRLVAPVLPVERDDDLVADAQPVGIADRAGRPVAVEDAVAEGGVAELPQELAGAQGVVALERRDRRLLDREAGPRPPPGLRRVDEDVGPLEVVVRADPRAAALQQRRPRLQQALEVLRAARPELGESRRGRRQRGGADGEGRGGKRPLRPGPDDRLAHDSESRFHRSDRPARGGATQRQDSPRAGAGKGRRPPGQGDRIWKFGRGPRDRPAGRRWGPLSMAGQGGGPRRLLPLPPGLLPSPRVFSPPPWKGGGREGG